MYANERISNSNNSLRYHLVDGWVGYFRNSSSPEPQVQVIDIMHNDGSMMPTVEAAVSQSRLEFEKYANVTPRRGGFIVLLHLHCCMRRFLTSICHSFIHFDQSSPFTILHNRT